MPQSINLTEKGKQAKEAAKKTSLASTEQKNEALQTIAETLLKSQDEILAANRKDIEDAKISGMDEAMIDRLQLEGRLESIAKDTKSLTTLEDPVGKTIESKVLENGLKLTKRRTPIGVLGVIYESRPNVTIDVAALSIKTGNCAILRGGSETLRSNQVLTSVIQKSLVKVGLPSFSIQLIESTDRKYVTELLQLQQYVDLIIPRGGAGLHQFCKENSHIPVITGGIGICHLYVEETADLKKSLEVIYNAKTQRPTVCNALDTLLVHEKIADTFIPQVLKRLGGDKVCFHLDHLSWKVMEKHAPQTKDFCKPAENKSWSTEWLSLILGIKVVKNLEEAINHIQTYSSGHSDGILTENKELANNFINQIDSACVYINASTRFTDGSQFGMGAEVAISTQKLHARGPMGLNELTTYKWIVEGNYQIRK